MKLGDPAVDAEQTARKLDIADAALDFYNAPPASIAELSAFELFAERVHGYRAWLKTLEV